MRNLNNINNKSLSNIEYIVRNKKNNLDKSQLINNYNRQDKLNKNRIGSIYQSLIIISLFFIILLISIVYVAGTISAASVLQFDFEKDGLTGDTSPLSFLTKKNLQNTYEYAKNNFQEVDGKNGYVTLENEEIIIFNSNNEQFAKIPKGFEIIKDSKRFIVRNNNAPEDSVLEIEKNKFKAEKGGEVIWDKEKKEISGKGAEIELSDGSTLSSKEFTGKLDENGNLMSLSTAGFSKYTDKNNNVYSGDDLKVYNDGTNPESVKGNAIFFGADKNSVTLRGIVQADNGKGLNYNGYSENTIAKFNLNTNSFDVKGGDARITNGENILAINNGKVSLDRENLASGKTAESFLVRYQDETGKILTATVDKFSGALSLSSIENGKVTGTAVVPLDSFIGGIFEVAAIQNAHVEELQMMLSKMKGQASKEQIDALELTIANEQNRNSNPSDGIDRINNYLNSERSIESKLNAKISLAELYAQRAANPIIPLGTNILDWEKTARTLSVRDYQSSIDLYKSVRDEATTNQLKESAGFGLALVYRQSGDSSSALQVYNDLINHGSSRQTISGGYLGIAQLQLDNNDIRRSLISLDNALSTNPDNLKAQQLKDSIINGVYSNIQNGLGNQLTEFEKAYEEKLALGGYKSLPETPGAALKSAFLNTGEVVWNSLGRTDRGISATFMGKQYEISEAQLGTAVYQQIRSQGYSDVEFAQLDFNEKKEIIAKAYDLTYIDEDKLKNDFIEANKGTIAASSNSGYFDENGYLDRYNIERDNFIKKLYSEEVLRQDKLVYDMTTASIEAKQKISDLDTITNPKKYSDLTNPDFKFKTGEGYIDPEGLKLTWKDSVLNQVNLVNTALILSPGATVTVAGKTMTVAGWTATGAKAIPGVETGIEAINTARISAAEALGLKTAAEVFPKTSAVASWVGKQAAYWGAWEEISRTVPYGEYVAALTIPIGAEIFGAETKIAAALKSAGVKSAELKGFQYFYETKVPGTSRNTFVPSYTATAEEIESIARSGSRLSFEELGVAMKGEPRLFKKNTGEVFVLRETPVSSIGSAAANLMTRPSSHNKMLDIKFGTSVVPGRVLADYNSYMIVEKRAGVAELVDTAQSTRSELVLPNFGEHFTTVYSTGEIKGLPLGFSSTEEFNSFRISVTRELDSLPISYNPSDVKIMGSSVTGMSSEYSKTPGEYFARISSDYDIKIVVNKEKFDQIAQQVRERFEALNNARPGARWQKDLKRLDNQDIPTGKLNSFYLNQISNGYKFEGNLIDIGKQFGVKKVQVSVVRRGSIYDTPDVIDLK